MKKILIFFILFTHISISYGQITPFRFVHISDTHIGSPNGAAEEDLRRTIADINQMTGVAFVILTGDITELGTDNELALAKQILDGLKIRYYIIPGNHDTGWSESGGVSFTRIFGNDKFNFDYNGIRFIGCASGPYVRMSDGHVPKGAIVWLDSLLKNTSKDQPIIFANHYPIDSGLDNWYDITDRLKQFNTIAIICGHGHTNKKFSFEDIPGIMGRSNLRARETLGGYNLVDVTPDSIIYSEKKPGAQVLPQWAGIKVERHNYDTTKKFARPDYSINEKYPQVKAAWTFSSEANVISTPAVASGLVICGDQNGRVNALSQENGKIKWSFHTSGAIYSSPATSKGKVVFGSADGYIYCLQSKNGRLIWKLRTGAAVLGSPVIDNSIVYIGGSDHYFRAIDLDTGKELWSFNGLDGPVVSTPLLYKDKIIFGAWDRHLYALSKTGGKLIWKWDNGSSVRNYSPASCIPLAINDVVYIVAPDRYITAIDVNTGVTLWRNNDGGVRESSGISADGKWVYGKSMQDTLVAYATSREKQSAAWKMNCGYGYEHVPSMLIEKEGIVFFGTRSGVVYAIDPLERKISWAYKIDNSMVNTVNVLNSHTIIASTMDGKVARIEIKH